MTNPSKVTKLTEKWVKRLRLENWDIDFNIVEPHKFSCGAYNLYGTCSVSQTTKDATIELSNELLVNPERLELTIVHELCHIIFNPHDLGISEGLDGNHAIGVKLMLYERMIDHISKVLVNAYA